MKNAAIAAAVVVAGLAGAVAYVACDQLKSRTAQTLAPAPAAAAPASQLVETLPRFQLADRAGQMRSLQDWPDRALIVNFWATWCAPCRREIPLLQSCSVTTRARVSRCSALGVTVDGKHYGLFGPQGSTWSVQDRKRFVNRVAGKPYCSLAILRERSLAALQLFQRHAHAHVTDTRVAWRYDRATSSVETTFSYATMPREGPETETLFALYPHQWRSTTAPLFDYQYLSIRGLMKVGKGNQFVTRHVYPGVLPVLPRTPNEDVRQVQELLSKEPDVLGSAPKDTYWEGKALGYATWGSPSLRPQLANFRP